MWANSSTESFHEHRMNLSHYKPTDPDMDCGDRQKGLKACGNAFPPDYQTAILLLKPGKGPLRLEPWDDFFDRSSPVFLALPDPLRQLSTDPTLAQGLAQGFRIIPL